INVAETTGPYTFHPGGAPLYFHSRTVTWVARDVPRSNFDQDLLYSFGAFMTICRIERNDAERRVRAMAAAGWGPSHAATVPDIATADGEAAAANLEELARDSIARLIMARFKGHGMARLVEAVLRAQGYTTYRSPEGPDKGID